MLRRPRPVDAAGRRHDDDALLDLVLALLLAGLGAASLLGNVPGERPADLLGLVLVLAGTGGLVVAHRFPLPVLVLTLLSCVALDQLRYPQQGLGLTVLWALYVVALRLPRRVSVPATLLTLLVVNLSMATAAAGRGPLPAEHVTTTVVLGAGWVFGRAASARRSRRTAEERAAVAEERTRVAREMQDLVAHELAGLTVQVAAARRLARSDQAAAEELLTGAESSARAAVGEVRRILDLLAPAGQAGHDRHPLPGLADLPDLAGRHSGRGLPVVLRGGRVEDVAPGPQLLAYRVVETALEEAWRSGAGRAEVSVDSGARGLRVEVLHERMPGRDTAGTDVTDATVVSGLARRAQLYGGSVDRKVGASGGSVVLEIPLAGARRTT